MRSRAAVPTIRAVDEYCDTYRDMFLEVRTFENFKLLHVGMISDIKRKSLPAMPWLAAKRLSQGSLFSEYTTITKLFNGFALVSSLFKREAFRND